MNKEFGVVGPVFAVCMLLGVSCWCLVFGDCDWAVWGLRTSDRDMLSMMLIFKANRTAP